MESVFQIVEIEPYEGNRFDLLVLPESHTIISPHHDISRYCGGIDGKERQKILDEIEDRFEDLVAYERQKKYFIPLTADTGCIELKSYHYCKNCKAVMYKDDGITTHVQECMNKPNMANDRAKYFYDEVEGFSYRCKEGTSYVLKRSPPQRYLPTYTPPIQGVDMFIKDLGFDEIALMPDFSPEIYHRDQELEKLMMAYTLKPRNFRLDDTHAEKAYGYLKTHSPYHQGTEALEEYGRNCCPVVYGMAKLSDDLGDAVANGDIEKFGAILFKDFVSPAPELDLVLNRALNYSLFSSPTSFHGSEYRLTVLKATTALLDFILYDNLDRTETRAKCDEHIKLYDRGCSIFTRRKILQYSFQNSGAGMIPGRTFYSIDNYKILVGRLMKEYDDYINTSLPEEFRGIDAVFDTFAAEVREDHGWYNSIFDGDKFAEEADNRLRHWAEGNPKLPRLRELANLSRMLVWMIYHTVGPPYKLTELLSLQHGADNTNPRSLFWDASRGTFRIIILHNKNKSPTSHYRDITKLVPPGVAKYIVHNLVVVRPLMERLAIEESTDGSSTQASYGSILHNMVFVSPQGVLKLDLSIRYLKKITNLAFQFQYSEFDSRCILQSMLETSAFKNFDDFDIIKFMEGHNEFGDLGVFGTLATDERQMAICEQWHRRMQLLLSRNDL